MTETAPAIVRDVGRSSIDVEPLTCAIGAELHGVHLGDAARDADLFAEIEALLLKHKVLFGSDYPVLAPEQAVADVHALGFEPAEEQRIFHDNAAELFGLTAMLAPAHAAPRVSAWITGRPSGEPISSSPTMTMRSGRCWIMGDAARIASSITTMPPFMSSTPGPRAMPPSRVKPSNVPGGNTVS